MSLSRDEHPPADQQFGRIVVLENLLSCVWWMDVWMDGWTGESVGVGLCVGMSGTLTARVYVVQVHSVQQIVESAPRESNSRASAAPHPCVGVQVGFVLEHTGPEATRGQYACAPGSRQIRSAATRPWGAHRIASHCWTQGHAASDRLLSFTGPPKRSFSTKFCGFRLLETEKMKSSKTRRSREK